MQSAIGDRITVNFENAGKVLINAHVVALDRIDEPPLAGAGNTRS